MSPRILTLCGLLVLSGAVVATQAAEGQVRSPFLPEQGAASSQVTQNAPLEYRGLTEGSDGIQFRIYDPSRKTGYWLRKGQRSDEFGGVLTQFDEARDVVTVDHGGRVMTLELRKGKILASANPGLPPQPLPGPPPPQSNVAPAVTQAVVLNPTPADEAKRLEAVAAEVARRRALREQAGQQQTNAPQPAAQPQVAPTAPVPLPQPAQNIR